MSSQMVSLFEFDQLDQVESKLLPAAGYKVACMGIREFAMYLIMGYGEAGIELKNMQGEICIVTSKKKGHSILWNATYSDGEKDTGEFSQSLNVWNIIDGEICQKVIGYRRNSLMQKGFIKIDIPPTILENYKGSFVTESGRVFMNCAECKKGANGGKECSRGKFFPCIGNGVGCFGDNHQGASLLEVEKLKQQIGYLPYYFIQRSDLDDKKMDM